MKKIYGLWLMALGLFAVTACESDRDSNPTITTPDSFVLNVPPYADNNVYDLEHSTSVELTCTQPDYGAPMGVTYVVQVSLEENFADANETAGTAANYVSLSTSYTSAKLSVDAEELALGLSDLWTATYPEEDLPDTPVSVYVRLKAQLTSNGDGTVYSNVVELKNVLLYAAEAALELPDNLYFNGSIAGSDWTNWVEMPVVNGKSKYFSLVYLNGSDSFKFGTIEGEYIGFNDSRVSVAEDAANLFSGVDDGYGGENIGINATGWYTLIISTSIVGKNYAFTLDLTEGGVYLIGSVMGQGTWGFEDATKFTAPSEANADFVSPACTAGGELRMSVQLPGEDWWRTEFTIPNNKIEFRQNLNVVNNWGDIGAEYSVSALAGQKVYLNFVTGEGSVK